MPSVPAISCPAASFSDAEYKIDPAAAALVAALPSPKSVTFTTPSALNPSRNPRS